MSNYHTVLFKSRNKDNKNLEGFKERSKTFLSDRSFDELSDKFEQFIDGGVEGELSRFYRSVNSRDIKKANTKLVHYLIDNPDFPPHKLQTKLVSLASEKNCAVENKWLFDYDYDENGTIQEFVEDVSTHVDESKIRIHPTVSGYTVTVAQGFDTRELLKKWENVSLHRDGQLLWDYRNK